MFLKYLIICSHVYCYSNKSLPPPPSTPKPHKHYYFLSIRCLNMNLHLSKQARKGLLQVEFMQQTCEYYVQAKRIFWKLGSPRFRWVLHTSMHLIHPTQQNLELLCILGGGSSSLLDIGTSVKTSKSI